MIDFLLLILMKGVKSGSVNYKTLQVCSLEKQSVQKQVQKQNRQFVTWTLGSVHSLKTL